MHVSQRNSSDGLKVIGLNQFQDDLKTLRHYLETERDVLRDARPARAALARIERFAATLENLDVHELPENPQRAPEPSNHCKNCGANQFYYLAGVDNFYCHYCHRGAGNDFHVAHFAERNEPRFARRAEKSNPLRDTTDHEAVLHEADPAGYRHGAGRE